MMGLCFCGRPLISMNRFSNMHHNIFAITAQLTTTYEIFILFVLEIMLNLRLYMCVD